MMDAGTTASFSRLITESDIAAFAALSGDHNPLHTDEGYAQKTDFKGRIVHGMFLGALVSALIGMHLPGRSALILKESLEFKKPARIGDEVIITGTVLHASASTGILEIGIEIRKGEEVLVMGSVHVREREEV